MLVLLRVGAVLVRVIGYIHLGGAILFGGFKRKKLPASAEEILLISAVDLADRIRNQKLKSEAVVKVYIERIKAVNPYLNAVVEHRFKEAIEDAQRADQLVLSKSASQIARLYPLLGVPFTVKESCGVRGLSFAVGNIHRKNVKASEDGEVVGNLRAAGAIPLLVSANPEFCLSWECNNVLTGRCNCAYDFRRTSGGSSGGEGALNGAGASVFGVGSDLAGSIRIPCLYNGLFGHKPTGGLLSIKGHFPMPNIPNFDHYLQLGPITRFAKDLPTLLYLMAGRNAEELNLFADISSRTIKIMYLEDAGFTLMHSPVTNEIKSAILRAVEHCRNNGHETMEVQESIIQDMQKTFEISLAMFLDIDDIPNIFDSKEKNSIRHILWELSKCVVGKSNYSFAALFFLLITETKFFFPESHRKSYVKEGAIFKKHLEDLLGTDTVLFYPTFHEHSLRHNRSFTNMPAVMFPMLCNVLGFPATHVPMGLDKNDRPVGFQIIAAPYQDKLCLTMAAELEAAFGGWVPPK